MKIKNFSDLSDPNIWDLSEHDDIIIIKENSNQQRVLMNFESYKILKEASNQYYQSQLRINDDDQFDLNPYLENLNTIVKAGNFKDITDQPHYFENLARKKNSKE